MSLLINLKLFIMKKISILFLSFLFVFASCSKDDDNTPNQVDSTIDITGSWELTGMEYEGESSQTVQGQTITMDYVGVARDIDAQVVFTENPNEVTSTGSYTIDLTMNYLGQTITQDYFLDFSDYITSASSWSIDGNEMTFESEGEVQTAEIVTLTQNMMVLLVEQTELMMGMEALVIAEVTLER